MRTFSFFFLLMAFVLATRTAAADPTGRVVVVEIAGDIEEPDALRQAIGAELHATAVVPNDPLATSARGTLTIDMRGADKRVSATYRALGAPVSRTVDLPEDPARARNVAVLLAGNVARQEADELLGGMKSTPPPPASEEDVDLARLRAILGELRTSDVDLRTWLGVGSLIEGGISGAVGTAYLLQGGSNQKHTRSAGIYFTVHGALNVGIGALLLTTLRGSYEKMANELDMRARTEGAASAVRVVEGRWESRAAEARMERRSAGWLGLVVGSLGAGASLAIPALVPDSQEERSLAPISYGLFTLNVLLVTQSIGLLATPTAVEQSWLSYRTMKHAAPAAPQAFLQPSIGFAPAKDGGVVNVGLTF